MTPQDAHDCPIAAQVDSMHNRIDSLEQAVEELALSTSKISATLESVAKEMERTNKSLETLAELQKQQISIETTNNARYEEVKAAIARAHGRLDKIDTIPLELEGVKASVSQLQELRQNITKLNYGVLMLFLAEVGALMFK